MNSSTSLSSKLYVKLNSKQNISIDSVNEPLLIAKFYKKGKILRSNFKLHFYQDQIITYKEKSKTPGGYIKIFPGLKLELLTSDEKANTSRIQGK